MTSTGNLSPGGSRKSLGVWLSVLFLVVSIFLLVRNQSDRSVPLQLQTTVPSAARVANSRRTEPSPRREYLVADLSANPSQSPLIRVNITPGGTNEFEIEIRGSYSIRQIGTSRELNQGRSLKATVQSIPGGLKIGTRSFHETSLEVSSDVHPGVRINDHLYRGRMRLFRRQDGLVSAVNVLPVEEYLASVVDSEMPASFPAAAREAQAIVARTYALYQIEHAAPAAVYDLFSSQRSQRYLGIEYVAAGRRLAGESASSRRAVAATRGIVCTYQKKLFCTYYSAVCGGRTTTGSELFADASPALQSVACEWCRDSEYYRWNAMLESASLLKAVQGKRAISRVASIRQIELPGNGKISQFELTDGHQTVGINGVELREQLPAGALRSPHFTLRTEKGGIRADGRGHGHGVGFCQWGARGLGSGGMNSQDIVRYYYPDAKLEVRKY